MLWLLWGFLILSSASAQAQVSKTNPVPTSKVPSATQTPAAQDEPAQVRQIEIVQADALEGFRIGSENVRLLIGRVVLKQEGVTLACDSAIFFPDRNDVRAYGNVRINQADTIQAQSDSLYFDGDLRILRLMSSVSLRDRSMDLQTEDMDYNLKTRVGRYRQGGRLNNKGSILTSRNGYYYSYSQTAFFQDSVVLEHPNYSLYADTLEYRTEPDLAIFHGPTRILHDQNTVYCESGSYDGQQEIGIFTRNAVLIGPPQTIRGDSIVYEQKTGLGRAWGNVLFTDSEQHIDQRSEYGEYDEQERTMYSTGRSYLAYILAGDSIFVSGDYVRSRTDSLSRRELFAYGAVRIFKSDLQAICDSMIWLDADSTITLYKDPVLWSDLNQFTGDTIVILIKNEAVHQVLLRQNAFIINQPDTLLFNQIKGRLVTGQFKDSELVKLIVNGNGQSIYYAEEEPKGYLGANKAECSNMVIRLVDQMVDRISFLEKTDAIFHDMKVDYRNLKLDGFSWRIADRPKSPRDLNRRIYPTETNVDEAVDASVIDLIEEPGLPEEILDGQ